MHIRCSYHFFEIKIEFQIIVNHVDHANSDLDYDFHSDFQPRQRQQAQPLPLRQKAVYQPQHQAPIHG